MKQNDIMTAAVVAISGFLVSLLLCNVLLGDPNENSKVINSIEPVSNEIAKPNPEVFNSRAINPTVEVYVGQCEDWDRNGSIDNAEWAACYNTDENSESENKNNESGSETNNNTAPDSEKE